MPKVPYYWFLDTLSRHRFNEVFFRNYKGLSEADLELWGREALDRFWRPRLFSEGIEQLKYHRDQGHRIVLISGGVEPTLQPLARLLEVDALVCVSLEKREARLTGRLINGPISGHAKAKAVRRVAEEFDLDLEECYAYADSYSDRQFLECVGYPVAVNPGRRLHRLAQARGWPVRRWTSHRP